MAHQVESMFFVGETPWHNLGKKLENEEKYNWKVASQKAGLNWNVELVPLQTKDGQAVEGSRAIRRDSDNRILGVVGDRYTPLQNADAFKWFQPFLENRFASLETAGSLKNGEKIWVLARIQSSPIEIVKDDLIEKYILLSHGHDGKLSVRAGFTPIRVVCANTLAMSHHSSESKLIKFRHTRDLKSNLENVRNIMNLANQEFEATAEQFRLLAKKSINQKDVAKYVKIVLGVKENEEISTRQNNILEGIYNLIESGKGNNSRYVNGTYWAAYNGMTEYLNYTIGNNADNRLSSLWFGPNADLNRKALETAVEMALSA